MTDDDLYKAAGVDVEAGNQLVAEYTRLAGRTARPGLVSGIGGFAGGFAIDVARYPNPVLFSGADGVGTKLKIAFATHHHSTVGIDCVAMCVNDILVTGAEPLYFLDYLAVGKLDKKVAKSVVAGVAAGCERAGCALIGGETAEMPGLYGDGEYDLAGFAVGVVNRDNQIDGSRVTSGDVVLGLASDGLHSNGFSLVRKLIAQAGLDWQDELPGWRGTVGTELLWPTHIYVRPILGALAAGIQVKAMAHITGGGLVDNVPRCLPENVDARLRPDSWPVAPVFQWLLQRANLSFDEAAKIWNLGIGFVVIVPSADVSAAMQHLRLSGETVQVIGDIVPGTGRVVWEA